MQGDQVVDKASVSGGVVRYSRAAGLLALLIGSWPCASVAQLAATPHAAVDVEHNSNVFDLSSSGAAPAGKNGATFGDTTQPAALRVDDLIAWFNTPCAKHSAA